MQGFVEWWCHLIGITDLTAISVAVGIVSGSLLSLAGYLIVLFVLWVAGWIIGAT